ncbi:MAG: glutathione S-transferase [Paracoccaceae bacterium]
MTYDLYIGDRLFSSWSLRGWLLFEKFGIPFNTHLVGLYSGTMAQDLAALSPARLVPAVRTSDGDVIGETMAIVETLAEQNPDAGHWPADPRARILARWLCAEMAAGFGALRQDCPMQLKYCHVGFQTSKAVLDDLNRIESLWSLARERYGQIGPWLFGDYSAADAFYAPVAARIIGYGLPVSRAATDYCTQTIQDPAFVKWRRDAQDVTYDPFPYPLDLPNHPWPTI